jgi:2-hydroxychromene-2-carboxylate isomerase
MYNSYRTLSHPLTCVGNKPPWTLPAKAKYGEFDSDRAKKYHGLEEISTPPFFPLWKETLVVSILLSLGPLKRNTYFYSRNVLCVT